MRAYAIRIMQQGWSHSGMLVETSRRAVGGDVRAFQKQGDTAQKNISNLSVYRVYAWHKCSR